MPAAIPVIAAIGSSLIAADAASSAADTQAAAADRASAKSEEQYRQTRADQLRQYEQIRADQAPYRDVGYSALDSLRAGMGLPAASRYGATQRSLSAIANDPTQQLTAGQLRTQLLPQFTTAGVPAPQSLGDRIAARNGRGEVATPTQMIDEAGLQAAINQAMAQQQQPAQQSFQTPEQIAAQNAQDAANPDFGWMSRRFSLKDYQADPGLAFRIQQGEQGINRAASARGGQYSGATLKALARFNSDLGSQEYGNAYSRFNADQTNQFNRRATLAGIGQTANAATGAAGSTAYGTIAGAGQSNVNQQAQALQSAGEARASGYVGRSNAIGSGIKQVYDQYQQNQALKNNNFLSNNASIDLSPSDLYSAF